jgi:undecaprenyl-diphosphatase
LLTLDSAFLAALLGIVEGLTEFIPVSSTGHLIIVGRLISFNEMLGEKRAGLFDVVIQLGAILAVGVYFRDRLMSALLARDLQSGGGRLRTNLFIAFLPAVIVGFLLHDIIKEYLFTPVVVALALTIGGIILIILERRPVPDTARVPIDTMTSRHALVVGLSQVLSLIPGVSRSGATIIGGMMGGMTRVAATEFSFLLSFPIMVAASGYDLLKYRDVLDSTVLIPIAVGFVTAFISAWLVVVWLIRFVQRHSFFGFGMYRLCFGVLMLLLIGVGVL